MASNIARNGLKVFMLVLIVGLLVKMTLGNNEIYQLGVGFGETLRDADGDLDLKDLDTEMQQFGEQLGDSPLVDKLLNNDFAEGVTYGYYKQEILGQ